MNRRRTLGTEGEEVSEEYELVGTAEITEEVASVTIPLSKKCTDIYLYCKKLKSTSASQFYIGIGNGNFFNGINGELSTTEQNTIQHIGNVGKIWNRTGNNHGTYPLTTMAAQMYRGMLLGNNQVPNAISEIILRCASENVKLTSGTIEIYGR